MHIRHDRKALLARVARIEGQIRSLRVTIEGGEDADCYSVMQQLAAARGALDGLTRLFIEGHIREHVAGPGNAARAQAAEDLILTLRSFLR
jgi:DNA-binding FrmR family transcriptional regulator